MSYDIIIELEAILVQIKYKWYKLIFATYHVGCRSWSYFCHI